jgi:GMP synthase (glutamine-hydrolysing)
MKIHCLQHASYEGPACIPAWVQERGYLFSTTRLDLGEQFPMLDDFELLIVLGGPMSVYRENPWPWMAAEKQFIRKAIHAGKVVLGICLGAQLIAAELGGKVRPSGEKEIGWFDVTLTEAADQSLIRSILPQSFSAFHWHGDHYELPAGAVRLASSVACSEQGFQYGDRVLALQFHLEATPEWACGLADRDGKQLLAAPFIQTKQQMLSSTRNYSIANEWFRKILDRLVDKAIGEKQWSTEDKLKWM